MKKLFIYFSSMLVAVACTLQGPSKFSGDLKLGEPFNGELKTKTPDTFRLDFSANTYLYGVVDQISVDVVVTLYDSTGNSLGLFDGPGVGPERFQFEIKKAGPYLLEVAPFKEDSGSYRIELITVEPIASDPGRRTDQIFEPYSGDDVPGGVVGVMQNGKLIYSKAYGMANLTDNVPFTVSTPSNIGSVTKQFTAFAILLLEQHGKLSLDDDVRKYIPELPDYGEVITLRNLLDHTNGLWEIYNLMPMTGWKMEDELSQEDVIRVLEKQKSLQAKPGEVYSYCNSAFILLAEIVERTTGTTFPEWMEDNVFGPLGMNSTQVRNNPRTIIPDASQGYTIDSNGMKIAGDLYASYGAGGIYTTVGDFNKWLNNFHDPVLGGEEIIHRLVTPDTLNNGDTMTYALGIGIGEYRGLKSYEHGGADIAHRAYLLYFPEIDAGVATLSNNAGFDAASKAYAVADAFFGTEMEPKSDEDKKEGDSTKVVVPEKLLKAYEGKYKIEKYLITMEYTLEDGVLVFSSEGQPDIKLIPESDSVFKYKGIEASVKFILDEDGKIAKAIHSQGGADLDLIPLAPFEPTWDKLKSYEGKYFSEEMETFYALSVKDSTLTLHIRNTDDIKLSPVEEDSFKGDVFYIGELAFNRNGKGDIVGFTVSNGRTKGIWFMKQ